MSDKPDLNSAYNLKTPEESERLYGAWADSYDQTFAEATGYMLPFHVAEAYSDAGGYGPVLDVGAGTGIVAEHLIGLDIGPVHGTDISEDMLAEAKKKRLYDHLFRGDLTQRLPVDDATYAGIISAGTFTHGHVGPDALDELLRIAAVDALFVLSINAEHFETAGFSDKFDDISREIKGIIKPKVRIYDENADADHKDDEAVIAMFLKA